MDGRLDESGSRPIRLLCATGGPAAEPPDPSVTGTFECTRRWAGGRLVAGSPSLERRPVSSLCAGVGGLFGTGFVCWSAMAMSLWGAVPFEAFE